MSLFWLISRVFGSERNIHTERCSDQLEILLLYLYCYLSKVLEYLFQLWWRIVKTSPTFFWIRAESRLLLLIHFGFWLMWILEWDRLRGGWRTDDDDDDEDDLSCSDSRWRAELDPAERLQPWSFWSFHFKSDSSFRLGSNFYFIYNIFKIHCDVFFSNIYQRCSGEVQDLMSTHWFQAVQLPADRSKVKQAGSHWAGRRLFCPLWNTGHALKWFVPLPVALAWYSACWDHCWIRGQVCWEQDQSPGPEPLCEVIVTNNDIKRYIILFSSWTYGN